MRTYILSFLFLLAFFISCKQNDDERLENVAAVDVYVAGAENNKASYWKNNQQQYLSNGDGITATDIVVENNNVYLAGYPQFVNDLQYYWKIIPDMI